MAQPCSKERFKACGRRKEPKEGIESKLKSRGMAKEGKWEARKEDQPLKDKFWSQNQVEGKKKAKKKYTLIWNFQIEGEEFWIQHNLIVCEFKIFEFIIAHFKITLLNSKSTFLNSNHGFHFNP